MKSLNVLVYSFLLLVSGFNISGASAEENSSALQSLTSAAQGLGVTAEAVPEAAAPAAPAWQQIPSETLGGGELNFWEAMQDGVWQKDFCENIYLPIEYGYEAENLGSVSGSVRRGFKRFPDRTLALVDEMGLKLELTKTRQLADLTENFLALPESAGISVTGGVRLEGSSIVIRPLGGKKACKDIPQLVNVLKYKTVMPLKAERFAAMKNGEVWKIPLTLWAGFNSTLSAEYTNFSVSVSFGVENQRLPTISLNRLSDHELRLRLRIDQARIVSYGAELSAEVAPVVTTLDNMTGVLTSKLGNIAGNGVAGMVATRFEDFTCASLGISHSDTKGKMVLLEFVLDPQDKAQMETLEKLLLEGGLSTVGELAKVATGWNFLPGHNGITDIKELEKMQAKWSGKLGMKPSYSGANGYHESTTEFTFHVPVLTDYSHSSGHNYQRAQSPGGGEVIHVHENFRESQHGLIQLPIAGTFFKHNRERTIAVLNSEADGKVSSPVMIYEHFEGAIRHSDRSAREMLDKANSIMRYVGTQGEGENSTTAIPVDALQPLKPVTYTIDRKTGEKIPSSPDTYRSAFMAFALVFNEKAVQDIVAAPASMVIKSFVNSLEGGARDLMKKVLSVSTVGEDGSVHFTLRDLKKAGVDTSRDPHGAVQNVIDQVYCLCRTAQMIVKDLSVVRGAADWKTQSEKLSKIIAGGGRSGLGYAEILKVLVQVVNPSDVAADMIYQTEKNLKGQDDVSLTYSYNHEDNPAFENADHYKEIMDHFDEPGQLSD